MVKSNIGMIVASILMLMCVASDLLFDFAFNFGTSDYIAFGFTLAAAIITFVATYKIKKQELTNIFDKTTAFLKSNFNKWQVLFSVLDIVCGAISIMAGLIVIGGIFKFVKIGYFVAKFIVVTNKSKTLLKSISKFSLIWTSGRILYKINQGGKVATKKLSKVQIASIIGAIVGIIFAFVSGFVPQIVIAGDIMYNLGISLGIEAVSAFVGTFKGYAERTQEEIDKLKAKKEEAEYKRALAIKQQYDEASKIIEQHQNKN